MQQTLQRRDFIRILGGSALAFSIVARANANGVPIVLDHIIIGCRDLDEGISLVEKQTGVRAAFGGVHPGRGTHNALLSLGERRYLEILAPDPKQKSQTWFEELKSLTEPKLIGWAAHPGNITSFADRLRAAKVACTGPTDGSRARPDGQMLHWKTLNLEDDRNGLLPFFIEWSADSPHPSSDAPKGCSLKKFFLACPDHSQWQPLLATLELDLLLESFSTPQLRASIAGPRGTLQISS
jgi:hypothetical protein